MPDVLPSRWWNDVESDEKARAVEQRIDGVGYRKVLEDLGITDAVAMESAARRLRELVSERRIELGFECDPYDGLTPEEIALVRAIRQKPRSINELCSIVDRGPETVKSMIGGLMELGFGVERLDSGQVVIPRSPPQAGAVIPPLWEQGARKVVWASASDPHFGSKAIQKTAINHFFRWATGLGARHFLWSGDIVAGQRMYRGQEYDLYAHGGDEQLDDMLCSLPGADGVTHYIMGGNHCASFYRNSGVDLLAKAAAARGDIVHCGWASVDVPITETMHVRMWHPKGSPAYALCLSEDTEILTVRGWVGWETINMSDEVATLNPETHALEYQRPESLYVNDYAGDMVHIESRTVDHLVTPDHDLWVRPYNDGEWRKVRARDVAEGYERRQYWQMMMGGCEWEGEEIDTVIIPHKPWSGANDLGEIDADEFLKFLGWYISEGNTSVRGRICITQSDKTRNGRESIEEIVNCMEGIGLCVRNRCAYGERAKHIRRIESCSADLVRWLDCNCGKGARQKRVPRFIMSLSKRQIGIFLDALFAGDGTKKKGIRWYQYNSASSQLRDDVQELMLKVGVAATVHKAIEYGLQWKGSVGVLQQFMPTINKRPELVEYSGKIWCVTVPNGLIYARRNGKPVWTGNSYRGQKYAEQIAAADLLKIVLSEEALKPKVRMLQVGHFHVMGGPFAHGPIDVVNAGGFEGQNTYLKELGRIPVIGGYVFEATITDSGAMRELVTRRYVSNELDDDWHPGPSDRTSGGTELAPLFQMKEYDE
jgi:hypothetical protein